MDKFLDIISRYHFLNFLIPGVIFLLLLNKLGIYSFNMDNIVVLLFGGYFAGMVLSRIGSVVIEPWFQKWRIVKYIPYCDFLKAEPKDTKISSILTDNNMYQYFFDSYLTFLLLIMFQVLLVFLSF